MPRPVLDDSVRLSGDGVLVLDRRVFPTREEWVLCRDAAEVAAAIREMVTQSSGPFYAGLAAMALTARQQRDAAPADAVIALREAARALTAARPTNNHVRDAVAEVLAAAVVAVGTGTRGHDLAELVERTAAALDRQYREGSAALGRFTAALLPDGARVLTHCWMDAYLVGVVEQAALVGRSYEWVATETRPYLQGARLTAHTLAEMGQHVTLVTDSTAAAVLSPQSRLGPVDALVTAADRVTMDGHVVNKVGTLGLAAAAAAFCVPFHALVLAPDLTAPTASDVVVEERDGDEVLSTLGARTASPLVTRGYYPAFDVTPPRLVTRIVTERGVYPPERVRDHHTEHHTEETSP